MRARTSSQEWVGRRGIGLGMMLVGLTLLGARPVWATSPALDLSSASIPPGGTAHITITLTRNGNPVTGTSNDIGFDSTVLSITPSSADCSINSGTAPGWVKTATKVCHNHNGGCTLDSDCTATGNTPPCDVVRIGALPPFSFPLPTIPSDGVLFTCNVHTDVDRHPDPDPDTNTDSDGDAHAHTHAHYDADADVDAKPNDYADADANSNGHADSRRWLCADSANQLPAAPPVIKCQSH
jgi:hypothetical protein